MKRKIGDSLIRPHRTNRIVAEKGDFDACTQTQFTPHETEGESAPEAARRLITRGRVAKASFPALNPS